MIQIINQRIFVEGKETTDAKIIGEALIQYVGNAKTWSEKKFTVNGLFDEELKLEYLNLVDRKTPERELIVEFILKENEFDTIGNAYEKFSVSSKILISRGTFYNTINSLVEHEILIKVPQKFKVNR